MLDIQELKEATELRSRLQTVSETGEWSFIGTRAWESGPAGCTAQPCVKGPTGFSLLAPQFSEVLSKCSHNVTETQRSLSCLVGDLLKSRDQIHEDNRRSVGFPPSV